MAWNPDPNLIRTIRTAGSGNIGDVLDRTNPKGRFRPRPDSDEVQWEKFAPVYLRGKFTGSGDQGKDTLQWLLDHPERTDGIASPYDFVLDEWEDMGFDSAGRKNLTWYLREGEFEAYMLPVGAELVLEWTDPGTTSWGFEFGWAPVLGGTGRI